MRFIEAGLPGVIIIEPDVFEDSRGYFLETYHAKKYADAGISGPFVQDNFSRSIRGTLRGLHYQRSRGQGKLVFVPEGVVFDVAVDIRPGSPTFGQWVGMELSAQNKRQLYIPSGFAHGFCVLSEVASFAYKCTDFYVPQDEGGILWNDPAIGISWPVSVPLLSAKDQAYKHLADIPLSDLPAHRP
ncbi:dTDP-4-dehydrorhamnose 3,5-epimerase [Nitrospira sp. Nam74]